MKHSFILRLSNRLPYRNVRKSFCTVSICKQQQQHFSFTSSKQSFNTDHSSYSQENLLKQCFDDEKLWNSYNNSKSFLTSTFQAQESGLFQNPYLKSPSGLLQFSRESLKNAKILVQHLLEDDTYEAKLNFIKNLDRLSDILCRVIDLAEFIRVAHPNKKFTEAAQRCHEEMFEFMNILNTSVELNNTLDSILSDKEICRQLTKEEITVGELLLNDFKKSGVTMNENVRNSFVDINQDIAVCGNEFNQGINDSGHNAVELSEEEYNSLGKEFQKQISSYKRKYQLPLYGILPFQILRTCNVESARKKIWLALHSAPPSQSQLLERILKDRAALAYIMNKKSYAHYQLEEKMAQNPENVSSFLNNLANQIKKETFKEIELLYNYKLKYNNPPLPPVKDNDPDAIIAAVKPWDRDFLSFLHTTKQRSNNTEQISPYFSIGTCLEGFSNLLKSIYGIELKPVKSSSGETWHNDVRKLHVVSETEGIIGIVYCDLFARENKHINPAHFTVVCSRRIYSNELNPDGKFSDSKRSFLTTEINGETYQLPIISLVLNLHRDSTSNTSLLSLSQLETLFHEMGHAMHSMLGRTSLHNVSGTRCPTDFVELPSVLMEHFAKDERVLLSFAKHHETGKTLPVELLRKYQFENDFLKNCETFTQIKMALLDQVLHSTSGLDDDFDSTQTYHELENNLKVFADTESNWHCRFGHLYSYGSVYYSYLFDRAIALKVWNHLFKEDPMNRENGEKFRNAVLKWGGSKNPWECLADCLDEPSLKLGDKKAMEFIGNAEI